MRISSARVNKYLSKLQIPIPQMPWSLNDRLTLNHTKFLASPMIKLFWSCVHPLGPYEISNLRNCLSWHEHWGPIDNNYDSSNLDRQLMPSGCRVNVVQWGQSQRLLFQIRVILLTRFVPVLFTVSSYTFRPADRQNTLISRGQAKTTRDYKDSTCWSSPGGPCAVPYCAAYVEEQVYCVFVVLT